jgi:hypothetical protein
VSFRVSAVALAVLAMSGPAAAEEVLLLLPKEFDVRPIGGWSRHGSDFRRFSAQDLQGSWSPFQFRGEEVTQESSGTDHHPVPDCTVDIQHDDEYRATFRRGELRGRWVYHQRNFQRSCKDHDDGEYMRVNHEGVITGQADADGRLKVTVQVVLSECFDSREEWVGNAGKGRYVRHDGWTKRNQDYEPWSFGFEFQLPVGELQSSQKISTPAPPPITRGPQAGAPKDEETPTGGELAGSDETGQRPAGEEAGPEPTPAVPAGTPAAAGAPYSGREAPPTGAAPPEDEPATPAESATATVGSGLLVGLGAWLVARANGTGLGDLLGGLGRPAGEPPSEPPRLLFEEPPHQDGERNDRGEAWDARIGGWVGENLYEQDRARDAWLAGKDATDLQAMSQPDALSEAAGRIAAADREIEARRQSIAAREAEIRKDEESIRAREEELGLDPLGHELEVHFTDTQNALSREGYRVCNPAYDQSFPVRAVIDGPMAGVGAVTPGFKPVRCKEMAELGAERLRQDAARLFGADADRVIVDTVKVEVVRPDSLGGKAQAFLDCFVPKDHGATRVILPDGRRFILDHWEAGRGGPRQIKSEKEWIERWKGRLGEDMRYCGGSDDTGFEGNIENKVAVLQDKYGQDREQAIDSFRRGESRKIEAGSGTPEEKARRLKQLETIVRSYERSGAFRSPGTAGRA